MVVSAQLLPIRLRTRQIAILQIILKNLNVSSISPDSYWDGRLEHQPDQGLLLLHPSAFIIYSHRHFQLGTT